MHRWMKELEQPVEASKLKRGRKFQLIPLRKHTQIRRSSINVLGLFLFTLSQLFSKKWFECPEFRELMILPKSIFSSEAWKYQQNFQLKFLQDSDRTWNRNREKFPSIALSFVTKFALSAQLTQFWNVKTCPDLRRMFRFTLFKNEIYESIFMRAINTFKRFGVQFFKA